MVMIGTLLLRALEASRHRRHIHAIAKAIFSAVGAVLGRVPGKQRCPVCNARLICIQRRVLSDELAREWGIDDTWRDFLDRREGQICISCGASLRVRHLASTLANWLIAKGGRATTIPDAVHDRVLPSLQVAEINACGALHRTLAAVPLLAYSEFSAADVKIRHEDLLTLTYANQSFDLVLHSDTLEHVPDVDRALAEIHRVLRPGGATIFTVPVLRDGRPTVVRAESCGDFTRHILSPSYHGGSFQATHQYLVYYEFGDDFWDRVSRAGFDVVLHEHPVNPTVITCVASKT